MNQECIVIVDNSDVDYYAISRRLSKDGISHDIVPLYFAEDLLAYMDMVAKGEQRHPAIILLDVNLPGISGLEALRQMRTKGIKLPPVFVITHSTEPKIAAEANKNGADAFMVKPGTDNEWKDFCRTVKGFLTHA